MALTDTAIRNAKPQAKPYKLTDEKGLFLLVQPSGGKLWRFKFRVDGRDEKGQPKRVEKKVGFGTYPDQRDQGVRPLAEVYRTRCHHHARARPDPDHGQPSALASPTSCWSRRSAPCSARSSSLR
ncbi:MAG: DUF4102 domain-containing protein [Starkeya sp.]|nr:DUF4102 domain-containing protein [Starkeya sp.]